MIEKLPEIKAFDMYFGVEDSYAKKINEIINVVNENDKQLDKIIYICEGIVKMEKTR